MLQNCESDNIPTQYCNVREVGMKMERDAGGGLMYCVASWGDHLHGLDIIIYNHKSSNLS